MGNVLRSVGLDVGTTSTQLIVSELTVENRAGSFSVPEMAIGDRTILYKSPVHFTPLLRGDLVDGEKLRTMVTAEYEAAGISRETVDTGAVIITGETSRRENAATVLRELAGFAGDFVVATAGPDLESVLAAKGSGAVALSEETGKRVLHMDIGGGTSNLALMEKGKILSTGCLNVGGRLVKFNENGEVSYLSSVLDGLFLLNLGEVPTQEKLRQLTDLLVQALQMAAGLLPKTALLDRLITQEATQPWLCQVPEVISFSGGVADCIENQQESFAYGDLGVLLGRAIRRSSLCGGSYRLGEQTIRATVIGAGCHSTQLSGSTVFYAGVTLPQKNLPVVPLTLPITQEQVANAYLGQDGQRVVLALSGENAVSYAQVQEIAKNIVSGSQNREILVCLEADMAKALGHAIRLLQPERPCLCIDRIRLQKESFLDIGTPVGPALPVVIKTLILSNGEERL